MKLFIKKNGSIQAIHKLNVPWSMFGKFKIKRVSQLEPEDRFFVIKEAWWAKVQKPKATTWKEKITNFLFPVIKLGPFPSYEEAVKAEEKLIESWFRAGKDML